MCYVLVGFDPPVVTKVRQNVAAGRRYSKVAGSQILRPAHWGRRSVSNWRRQFPAAFPELNRIGVAPP
jgi:hypothetical protein